MAVDQATESRTEIKQYAHGHYVCPECGATAGERTGVPFKTRASISAHRWRLHKVHSEGWADKPRPKRSNNRNGKHKTKALVLQRGVLPESQFCFVPLGTPDGAHLIVKPDARSPQISMGFVELAQVGSGFMGHVRMKHYKGGNLQ